MIEDIIISIELRGFTLLSYRPNNSSMNKLICVFVVSGLVAVTLCRPAEDGDKEKGNQQKIPWMQELMQQCKEEEKAKDAGMKSAKDQVAPATPEGKCLPGCVFDKMGLMDNGAFSKAKTDEAIKNYPLEGKEENRALWYKLSADCEKEIGTGNDKCETGVKIMECYRKNRPSFETK